MELTDWLAWRKGGITASDIAMAVSGRYGGAYAVVARKLDLLPAQEQTDAMRRGLEFEERIQTAAEVLWRLRIVGEQTLIQHQYRPEFRATLDGMAVPHGIEEPTIDDVTHGVEVKTRGENVPAAWDYWKPQTQWQMLCSGLPRTLLAEAVCGSDDEGEDTIVALKLHVEEADPDYQALLIEIADDLLRRISEHDLPEPDAGALDIVKQVTLAVADDAPVVDLSEMAADVDRWVDLKQAEKLIEAERKAIEARLRTAIGPATTGETDRIAVNVSKRIRERTSEGNAAFLAKHPHLAKPLEIDVDRAKADPDAKADFKAIPTTATGARRITHKEKK